MLLFSVSLHQALHTMCDTTQTSIRLQVLHLLTMCLLSWEYNKGNTIQRKSDRKGESLGSSSSYTVT